MDKPIRVVLSGETTKFLRRLDEKTRQRFLKNAERVENGGEDNTDIFKKLSGTDGIWEFRFKDYRVLAFWDKRGDVETLVICSHGFQKKRDKVPRQEIDRAEKAKRAYFDQ